MTTYVASKERIALIEAVVGGADAFTEAWLAPHATVRAIRGQWPIGDYDARAYALHLGLSSRPGRIVAVEPAESPPAGPPLAIPEAVAFQLVDTLAEAVADRVYELLEERLSRKARRGLFGTGR